MTEVNTQKSSEGQQAMMKIINKAAWLLSEGRVVKISPYMYYVIGRNSKHLVKYEGGRFACTCKGFESKGFCSHVLAVMTLSGLKDASSVLDEAVKQRVMKELKALSRRT
ncbi:MAG: SWIM zinc finger family protein [Thermofilum sp.]